MDTSGGETFEYDSPTLFASPHNFNHIWPNTIESCGGDWRLKEPDVVSLAC